MQITDSSMIDSRFSFDCLLNLRNYPDRQIPEIYKGLASIFAKIIGYMGPRERFAGCSVSHTWNDRIKDWRVNNKFSVKIERVLLVAAQHIISEYDRYIPALLQPKTLQDLMNSQWLGDSNPHSDNIALHLVDISQASTSEEGVARWEKLVTYCIHSSQLLFALEVVQAMPLSQKCIDSVLQIVGQVTVPYIKGRELKAAESDVERIFDMLSCLPARMNAVDSQVFNTLLNYYGRCNDYTSLVKQLFTYAKPTPFRKQVVRDLLKCSITHGQFQGTVLIAEAALNQSEGRILEKVQNSFEDTEHDSLARLTAKIMALIYPKREPEQLQKRPFASRAAMGGDMRGAYLHQGGGTPIISRSGAGSRKEISSGISFEVQHLEWLAEYVEGLVRQNQINQALTFIENSVPNNLASRFFLFLKLFNTLVHKGEKEEVYGLFFLKEPYLELFRMAKVLSSYADNRPKECMSYLNVLVEEKAIEALVILKHCAEVNRFKTLLMNIQIQIELLADAEAEEDLVEDILIDGEPEDLT